MSSIQKWAKLYSGKSTSAKLLVKAIRSIVYFIPSIVWAAIIYGLSSNAPLEELPFDWMDLFEIDKVGHFVFYCILCLMLLWGLRKSVTFTHRNNTRASTIAISIAFIYGVIMEILQYYFYEGRQLDFLDMVANGVGAIAGALIFFKILYKG